MESLDAEEDCPICMDTAADAVTAPCGHSACVACLVTVKATTPPHLVPLSQLQRSNKPCPICRKDIRILVLRADVPTLRTVAESIPTAWGDKDKAHPVGLPVALPAAADEAQHGTIINGVPEPPPSPPSVPPTGAGIIDIPAPTAVPAGPSLTPSPRIIEDDVGL
mmetsp:Transcript_41158/g.88994  ORF Transcript_41158/g.88994 Transcript_41158/m.88994 type:complete len:165 (-) Transcript_41158:1109-1603(-)